MTVCLSCNRKTASGAFCERCGAPLPAKVESSPTVKETSYSFAGEAVEKTFFTSSDEDTTRLISPTLGAKAASPYISRLTVPIEQPVFSRDVPIKNTYASQVISSAPSPAYSTSLTPVLRIDKLCVLFENTPGFVRFFFDPCFSCGLENVKLTFENILTGEKVSSRVYRVINRSCEIPVQFPAMEAGALVWSVRIDCEINFRRRTFEGDLQMAVIRPKEAQKVAENFAIHITNNIHNGNASDVSINQRAADELARIATSENPFEELRRIVLGAARSWDEIVLFDADEVGVLPEMPLAAKAERVTLDLGLSRITFFANRCVTFGRTVESNDFTLRPTADADDKDKFCYRLISRCHCFFEHLGDKVAVYDGRRNHEMVIVPSTGGTYWNDTRICGKKEISSGQKGILSFAGLAGCGAVSIDAKVIAPCSVCAKCPHSDKRWCDDGKRPSLLLSRRDGRPESFVALWSCFHLAEVDPSFRDVVIFRKNGAFAWRRGRRTGWLIPNTSFESEFGIIKVS
jgi:hypothetical protein